MKHYFYIDKTRKIKKDGFMQEFFTVIEVENGSDFIPDAEDYARAVAKKKKMKLAGGYFSDKSIPWNFKTNYRVIKVPKGTKPLKRNRDLVDDIMAYEGGNMTPKQEDKFLKKNAKTLRGLQGSYGRELARRGY